MNEIFEKDLKNFEEWSEGNKYLFELLCSCKRKGIRTYSSCGGHEVTLNTPYEEEDYNILPYIGVILEDSSADAIINIVNVLKKMQNIEMRCFERFDEEKNEKNIGLTIFAHHSNCCEMFYKANSAINGEQIIENPKTSFIQRLSTNVRARQFMRSAERMLRNVNEGKEGTSKELRFDTYTKEMQVYLRCEGRGFGNRDKIKDFDKLYQKYGMLQKEYTWQSTEQISGLIESPKENVPSWDLSNWEEQDRQRENIAEKNRTNDIQENDHEL